MQDRYQVGGYAGPSDMIPPDTGGVEMRAPEALPFNRAPGRDAHAHMMAAADDPRVRRRLPFYAVALLLVMLAIAFFFVSPTIGVMLLIGYLPLAGLIHWLRSGQ